MNHGEVELNSAYIHINIHTYIYMYITYLWHCIGAVHYSYVLDVKLVLCHAHTLIHTAVP